MSKHTNKESRGKATVKIAIVALAIGGGATVGYAKHNPNLLSAQSAPVTSQEATEGQTVTLHKSPTCTCCGAWGDHLREAGFEVQEVVSDDVQAILEERGVPMHLRSCHLGVVGDYVVVGHIPADVVARLLKEKPAVTGIAVPGMPRGTPGMEGLGGKVAYDVIAFGPNGAEHVFESR